MKNLILAVVIVLAGAVAVPGWAADNPEKPAKKAVKKAKKVPAKKTEAKKIDTKNNKYGVK
jgi:hypothetical protein